MKKSTQLRSTQSAVARKARGAGVRLDGTARAGLRGRGGARTPDRHAGEPDDTRLNQLLAVEARLEALVRAAEADGASRIASARAAREQRLAIASREAMRADAERARAERAARDQALAALEAAHRDALAGITDLPDSRIDQLARWVVARVIGVDGEPA